jgi:hypothetical protein
MRAARGRDGANARAAGPHARAPAPNPFLCREKQSLRSVAQRRHAGARLTRAARAHASRPLPHAGRGAPAGSASAPVNPFPRAMQSLASAQGVAAARPCGRRAVRRAAAPAAPRRALTTYSGMRRAGAVDLASAPRGAVCLRSAVAAATRGGARSATRRASTTAMFEVRSLTAARRTRCAGAARGTPHARRAAARAGPRLGSARTPQGLWPQTLVCKGCGGAPPPRAAARRRRAACRASPPHRRHAAPMHARPRASLLRR